mmetsp:Transcript_10736/g.19580  ORF Transcript_10736/g.19580 Transcript_10736/m.19580 type:complete len:203 (+) Transcript_10736:1527-2135(+)
MHTCIILRSPMEPEKFTLREHGGILSRSKERVIHSNMNKIENQCVTSSKEETLSNKYVTQDLASGSPNDTLLCPVSIRKSARGVHGIISSSASITIRATPSTSSVTRGSGVIVDSATQTCFGFQRGFHSLFFHGLSFFGAPCFFGLLPQSCRFLLLRRTNPAHILLQGRDTSWIMNDPQRCPLPSTFHPRIQHIHFYKIATS